MRSTVFQVRSWAVCGFVAAQDGRRRARAAAVSLIPTTTGAAEAIVKLFPHLEDKLNGYAIRVPVPDGSLTDFTCTLKRPVTKEEINAAFKNLAETEMTGILEYQNEPIVSVDIVGNSHSSIFDSLLITIITDEGKEVEDNAMLCLFHYKEIIKQVGSGE